jgi:thioredoxin-like negative regulator of GroEL
MSNTFKSLGNLQHLQDLQEFKKTFLVFVYSDTCKPCQRLKPELAKKTHGEIEVYMIPCTQDEKVNALLEVKKIPHVVVIKDGQIRGGIQDSDINVTWPFIELCLETFRIEEEF